MKYKNQIIALVVIVVFLIFLGHRIEIEGLEFVPLYLFLLAALVVVTFAGYFVYKYFKK